MDDFRNFVIADGGMPARFERDILLYNVPKGRWRRWWFNLRRFVGRVVPRVYPKPDGILKNAYPIACEQMPSGEVTIEHVEFKFAVDHDPMALGRALGVEDTDG